MKPFAVLATWAVVLLGAGAAHACAGCSNPNLPAARGGMHLLKLGQVAATVNLTATTMKVLHSEHCPDIGPICAQRDEPPQLHDQRFYVAELRPIVEVGLGGPFAAELQLPFRLTRSLITFRRTDGTAFTPDYENIHHRNETLAGIGDPWLLGRHTFVRQRFSLSSRTGVALPLGRTEENPFALGRAGLSHQHVQFGTGTFAPLLALDGRVNLGRWSLTGYGQAMLFLYENGSGYRAGNRYVAGLGTDLPPLGKVRFGLGADLVNEQPERWDGLIQQDGNVGRTDLLVGGNVGFPLGKWWLNASVRAPVWQYFLNAGHMHEGDPGQLEYPAIVSFAVQRLFL